MCECVDRDRKREREKHIHTHTHIHRDRKRTEKGRISHTCITHGQQGIALVDSSGQSNVPTESLPRGQ